MEISRSRLTSTLHLHANIVEMTDVGGPSMPPLLGNPPRQSSTVTSQIDRASTLMKRVGSVSAEMNLGLFNPNNELEQQRFQRDLEDRMIHELVWFSHTRVYHLILCYKTLP